MASAKQRATMGIAAAMKAYSEACFMLCLLGNERWAMSSSFFFHMHVPLLFHASSCYVCVWFAIFGIVCLLISARQSRARGKLLHTASQKTEAALGTLWP